MSAKSLDTHSVDRDLRIDSVNAARPVRRRLLELGLLPGTAVRLIRKATLSGVLELEVRSSRFTLSLDQARLILASER